MCQLLLETYVVFRSLADAQSRLIILLSAKNEIYAPKKKKVFFKIPLKNNDIAPSLITEMKP